jgi:hypothetical protein
MLARALAKTHEQAGRILSLEARTRLVRLFQSMTRLEELYQSSGIAAFLSALVEHDRQQGELGETSQDLRENAPFNEYGGFRNTRSVNEYRRAIRDSMLQGNRRSVYAAIRRAVTQRASDKTASALAAHFLVPDAEGGGGEQRLAPLISNGIETDLEELVTLFLNIVTPEHELSLREFDVALFFFRLTHSAFAPPNPQRRGRRLEHKKLPRVLFASPAMLEAFEEQRQDWQVKLALAAVPRQLLRELVPSVPVDDLAGSILPTPAHIELRRALADPKHMAQYDAEHVLADWDRHADLLRANAPLQALVVAYRSQDAPPAGLLLAAVPVAVHNAPGLVLEENVPPLYFYASFGMELSHEGIRETLLVAQDPLSQIKLLEFAQVVAPAGANPLLVRLQLPKLEHVHRDKLWALLDAAKRFAQLNEEYLDDPSVADSAAVAEQVTPSALLAEHERRTEYARYLHYMERQMKQSAEKFNLELVRLDTAVAIFDAIVTTLAFMVDGTLSPPEDAAEVKAELSFLDVAGPAQA